MNDTVSIYQGPTIDILCRHPNIPSFAQGIKILHGRHAHILQE